MPILKDYTDSTKFECARAPLPTPQEVAQSENETLDLRGRDCSQTDLSAYNPQFFSFDDHTIWPKNPSKMPKNFNPYKVMEMHKDPGLTFKNLKRRGLRGKGMVMAIIDQPLSDHEEYHDNIVHYEELGPSPKVRGSMHGSAVASLAVGKTCGVLPDAKLYYFAADHGNNGRGGEPDSRYYAQALERIMEINSTLPKKNKIQVVSISWGGMAKHDYTGAWAKALQHAQKEGLVVVNSYTFENVQDSRPIPTLDRKYDLPPDITGSYSLMNWQRKAMKFKQQCNPANQLSELAFPSGHVTTASPTGKDCYVHYRGGSYSWKTPIVAALFLMARQVNKNVTPENFLKVAIATGTRSTEDGLSITIVNPEKLIDSFIININRKRREVQPEVPPPPPPEQKSPLKLHIILPHPQQEDIPEPSTPKKPKPKIDPRRIRCGGR